MTILLRYLFEFIKGYLKHPASPAGVILNPLHRQAIAPFGAERLRVPKHIAITTTEFTIILQLAGVLDSESVSTITEKVIDFTLAQVFEPHVNRLIDAVALLFVCHERSDDHECPPFLVGL